MSVWRLTHRRTSTGLVHRRVHATPPCRADLPHGGAMATVDVRAAAVAVFDIATDRELVAAGVSPRTIRRRIAQGTWERLAPGVVRLRTSRDWRQSVRAAVVIGPANSVVSHVTAARLHDIGGLVEPGPPDVTLPRGLRYVSRAIATVHTTTRLVSEPIDVAGLPVTPVARTLRDLAGDRRVAPHLFARTLRDAFREGLVTPDEVLEEAEPRGPGRRRLREGVEAELRVVGQATDSRLERAWGDVLLEAGITGFVTQHEVVGDDRTARIDIAWPELRLAIEVDGARFHADALAAAADHDRACWLEARGWTVIRVTAADLRSDRRHLALAEIRAVLADARATLQR